MEHYNHLISSHLLDNYDDMINVVPQPTMFGGKRLRQHPLPASTDYDYPATLAVGSLRGRGSADETVGGSFWSDFAQGPLHLIGLGNQRGGVMMRGEVPHMVGYDGHGIYNPPVHFPSAVSNAVPMMVRGKGRKPKATKKGGRFNLGGFFKSIGHALAPVGHALAPIATNVASDALVGALAMGRPKGRPRKAKSAEMEGGFNFGKMLKSVGKVASPILTDVASKVATNALEDAVGAGKKPRGRPRKAQMDGGFNFGKALKSVAKVASPIAKSVGKDVVNKVLIPEGKKQLTNLINTQMGSTGGALITNHPSQFHSSVYPPALASYHPSGDAHGRGRAKKAKLPKSGAKRNSARGAIVAEVMKKQGLNLAQASKYVKEHGLY